MINRFKYLVKIDSREKKEWLFPSKIEGQYECLGTKKEKLDEGDYSIEGYEDRFVIEKKCGSLELSNNIWEPRFEKELQRLEKYQYPFLIAECEYKDLVLFPIGSGLPRHLYHKVESKAKILEQIILKYQLIYKTKWLFVGQFGQRCAEQLIHRFLKYGVKK